MGNHTGIDYTPILGEVGRGNRNTPGRVVVKNQFESHYRLGLLALQTNLVTSCLNVSLLNNDFFLFLFFFR